jgi:hypothetical protein
MSFTFQPQVLLLCCEAADTRECITADGRIVSGLLIENYVERSSIGQIGGIISEFDWRDRGDYEKPQRRQPISGKKFEPNPLSVLHILI